MAPLKMAATRATIAARNRDAAPLTTAAMVLATAVTPVAMGWLIDKGVSLNVMAQAGACYTVLASALALLASYRRRSAADKRRQ